MFAAGSGAGAGVSAGSSVPHQSQVKSVPVFSLRHRGQRRNCRAPSAASGAAATNVAGARSSEISGVAAMP